MSKKDCGSSRVFNPLTGRCITKDGTVHKKLIREGVIKVGAVKATSKASTKTVSKTKTKTKKASTKTKGAATKSPSAKTKKKAPKSKKSPRKSPERTEAPSTKVPASLVNPQLAPSEENVETSFKLRQEITAAELKIKADSKGKTSINTPLFKASLIEKEDSYILKIERPKWIFTNVPGDSLDNEEKSTSMVPAEEPERKGDELGYRHSKINLKNIRHFILALAKVSKEYKGYTIIDLNKKNISPVKPLTPKVSPVPKKTLKPSSPKSKPKKSLKPKKKKIVTPKVSPLKPKKTNDITISPILSPKSSKKNLTPISPRRSPRNLSPAGSRSLSPSQRSKSVSPSDKSRKNSLSKRSNSPNKSPSTICPSGTCNKSTNSAKGNTISERELAQEINYGFYGNRNYKPKATTLANNNLFDLTLKTEPKFYALSGASTLWLRDAIPPNFKSAGRIGKPLYNRKNGYMYFKNPENKAILERFLGYIYDLSEKYKNYQLGGAAPLDKQFGTLGYDVPFTEPKWLKESFDKDRVWDAQYNPEILPSNQWLFKKCAFTTKGIDRMLKKASESKQKDWSSLYPKLLFFKNTFSPEWSNFLQDDSKNAALAGWGGHARFLYKEPTKGIKHLYIYDPWKQSLPKAMLNKISGLENGLHVEFIKRNPDQAHEGSCALISLVRAIMMAEFGKKSALEPIIPAYAVYVSRLASLNR